MSDFPYIHGFSSREMERLREQARFTEQKVYPDIDFYRVKQLLEVGCGVGGQSEILLRRFPNIFLTGVDRSEDQLVEARNSLGQLPHCQGRYEFIRGDAGELEFEAENFDAAFVCWLLEHVQSPLKILNEVRRVLKPGSPIYVTEVMNSSFLIDPYSPSTWKYWLAFNDFQIKQGGDPFVGAKLGNYLMQSGFRNISTNTKVWHLDNREPGLRKEMIDYWTGLLLSVSEQLLECEAVDQKLVDEMKEELNKVSREPNAVFYYSFMQATAIV
jgi:ubiquinone/menaquinone biosynthesis C-methylase UbiE